MKVVITPNPYRDKNLRCAMEAKAILERVGVKTSICLAFEVDKDFSLPRYVHLKDLERELQDSDVLVCFGGDGTMLHASKAATRHGVPILGVNIGTMGFMTELEAGETGKLAELVKRNYILEDRMMLDVAVIRDGEVIQRDQALNDAVVTKGAVARIIQMDLFCDGVEAMRFGGDGVIVCTPTGSTGYSLSAGGPVVEPAAENIILTPICAHTMMSRTIVAGGNRIVDVKIGRIGRKNAFLSVDGGRAFRLNAGDIVRVRRSASVTRLVKFGEKNFFDILNNKLG